MFGLGSNWRDVIPILPAVLVTGLLTWAVGRLPEELDTAGGSAGWIIPLLLVLPFIVSSLWGWALLVGRPRWMVLAAAVGLQAILLGAVPQDIAWQVGGNMAAGLAAGLALGSRWRLDAALLAVILCLAPVLVWSALEMPLRENIDVFGDSTLDSMEPLWQGLDESQREAARQLEAERLEAAAAVMEKIFPALLAVGELGQAALILFLVAWFARLSGGAPGLQRIGPFTRWRMPFYLVWCLVLGVGLMVTRLPYLASSGLNLVLVTGLLIGVQGLALQAFFTARLLPGAAQVIFWMVMGVPLIGMLLVSSVVLGLADQWMDMRRHFLAREIE